MPEASKCTISDQSQHKISASQKGTLLETYNVERRIAYDYPMVEQPLQTGPEELSQAGLEERSAIYWSPLSCVFGQS